MDAIFADWLSGADHFSRAYFHGGGREFLWLVRGSDVLIGLSFVSICRSLLVFAGKARLPYGRVLITFGILMAAAGAAHLMDAWNMAVPSHWWAVVLKLAIALGSATTAVVLYPLLPRAVKAVQGLHLSETRRRMLEDYSDELRAVNTLREREARNFEAILSASSDQIFRLEPGGIVEYCSPAAATFLGKTRTTVIGSSWADLGFPEEAVRQLEECRKKVLESAAERRGHIALPGAGGIRSFDFLCAPIVVHYRVIALTFNLRDATERKSYEEKIRQANSELEQRVEERTRLLSQTQKRFQDLVNTIDGIVWEADVGRPGFTFVSSQAERLTGYPWERWMNEEKFWQKLLYTEDLGKITGDRYVYPDSKRDLQSEYRIVTASGQVLWIRDHIKVIFEQGMAKKMRGIMVDVTAQKRGEEELKRATEASQRASQAKSDFLANMSHEIRTPLNAIVGMSSLSLDGQMDLETRDSLQTIHTAGNSLLVLINDILDFSKIEAGGVLLEVSDFSLSSLSRNAFDVIQPLARAKSILLTTEISPDLPPAIRGDSGRLLQILLNLLGNAVKFTPEGGFVGMKASAPASGKGKWIRFEVRDSGIGINESVKQELFRPFTQADSSTARKFGGTGLGLSICKRLAELMEGRIGVESEEGKGSVFWIELPLQEAETSLDALEEDHGPADPPKAPARPVRVLVADDNPANQKVIRRFLEKLGHSAEVVANGAEAVRRFERGRFDLIFMDCQMPEMDGYEATRVIRERERADPMRKRIPVLALTAHALKGDREKCQAAGMDDYLPKPVGLRPLARAIDKWVNRPLRLAKTDDKPAPAEASEAIDKAHLQSLESLNAPGKPDLIRELAAYFLECNPTRLAGIGSAFERSDREALFREAHSFKSTCYNVGAMRLAGICAEIESNNSPEAAPEGLARTRFLLGRLAQEASSACGELTALLATRKAA